MSLSAFFEAKSVAVVGASRHKGKVGYEVMASLVRDGFEGPIYPINPNADEVEGRRCFASLADIGSAPDLVVIAVPAQFVADVIRQCAAIGVKNVIVNSSGFQEVGEAGLNLQGQVVQLVREAGMSMVGPNCLGIMVPSRKLNASFGGRLPKPGPIGFFSQSGSLLAAIADMARDKDLGFSRLISIGNMADINELDVLKALGRDSETKVIAGYLETITDGDAFIREAERISREKPILLMKAGQTGAGAIAASSHTGRLAAAQQAYEVVFERAGIIRCPSITAQFDYARALACQPLPAGGRIVVIANAGGAGIMAADAVEQHGLQLAQFTEATAKKLASRLPAGSNQRNPVDLLGDALADRFAFALEAALDDPNVDGAMVLLTPHAMTECTASAEAIVRVAASKAQEGIRKPILACFLGAGCVSEAIHILRKGGIPNLESPEFGVAAMKVMVDYGRWRRRPKRVVRLFPVNRRKVEKIINQHLRLGQTEIGETEAKEMLEAYGFVTPKGLVATSPEQAAEFAEQIGYPVVLKIWSPDIVHKAEVGGVRKGLSSAQEVMDAFDLMMYRLPPKCPQARILGVLVQETVKKGQEVVMGMTRHPHYGPLLMFGMGGVFVETLKEVAFYLAPLTGEEAKDMLMRTRTFQMLRGGDGRESVDIETVAEGLQRLSQLAMEFPQIRELDINPYVVGPQGTTAIAVDAHMTLNHVARK